MPLSSRAGGLLIYESLSRNAAAYRHNLGDLVADQPNILVLESRELTTTPGLPGSRRDQRSG
jgi:hypothetical protein